MVNTLPTQTATYTVVGVNNINGSTGNFLIGNLEASFGGNNLFEGYLYNSNLTIDILANIDSSDASFAGAAFANTGDDVIVVGASNGQQEHQH